MMGRAGDQGTTVQGDQGTTVPGDQGTTVPGDQGTTVPGLTTGRDESCHHNAESSAHVLK